MFVNLTPHDVVLQSVDGSVFRVPKSATPARIDSKASESQYIQTYPDFTSGIAVYGRTEYGAPVGIPEYDPNGTTIYIVSALFAGRVGDRNDVVHPGTGPKDNPVRDDKGQVIAVTRLVQC